MSPATSPFITYQCDRQKLCKIGNYCPLQITFSLVTEHTAEQHGQLGSFWWDQWSQHEGIKTVLRLSWPPPVHSPFQWHALVVCSSLLISSFLDFLQPHCQNDLTHFQSCISSSDQLSVCPPPTLAMINTVDVMVNVWQRDDLCLLPINIICTLNNAPHLGCFTMACWLPCKCYTEPVRCFRHALVWRLVVFTHNYHWSYLVAGPTWTEGVISADHLLQVCGVRFV